jgi:hypothetical protein
MSRDVGRFRSTREATALPALPHLQLATLPGAAATSPSHLATEPPERGGGLVTAAALVGSRPPHGS